MTRVTTTRMIPMIQKSQGIPAIPEPPGIMPAPWGVACCMPGVVSGAEVGREVSGTWTSVVTGVWITVLPGVAGVAGALVTGVLPDVSPVLVVPLDTPPELSPA